MRLRARNRIVTGALLLLVLLVVVGALLSTAPPARAADTFRLDERTVPVGMATDHARDRYWLLGRSTGRLTLTALAADGTVQGQMTSRDQLVNAQALAFESGQAYVGDVGGRRAQVVVYHVIEPWPRTEIKQAIAYRLAYPDGPHDASAIIVDAALRLHVVTTGPGAGIYRAPANPSRTEVSPLERIADAPDGVTDAVALVDGRWVLRTATSLVTLDPDSRAVLGQADVGAEQRGQAVTESLTAGQVATAAGAGGEVTVLPAPGPAPTTPVARPSSRSVPPEQASTAVPTRTYEQVGTLWSLAAALVVAGIAALVVLVRR